MRFLTLFWRALRVWFRQDADQHAAALAYFTPFALTPLVIMSITIVGFIYGSERVIALLVRWGNIVDPAITALLYDSVQNFHSVGTYYYWPVIGAAFLSLMVYVALNSLTAGLQKMWGVATPNSWRAYIGRLIRITVFIVVLQAYLFATILFSDVMSYLDTFTSTSLAFITWLGNFALTMVMLAVAYGVLTTSAPSFYARLVGASVAGVLLLFSRSLVEFHFQTAPVQSLFGAAGLLISLLVWVYVVAGVILYGAAFAHEYDIDKRSL